MAINLNTLVNDYGTYTGNSLVGELGSTANIPNKGFTGVRGVAYDNITFIIEIDGIKYASSKWLSQQQNTPYQDESTVAGAGLKISTSQATTIPADNQGQTLSQQENYAEVRVSKNLKTADDILKHINWLVDDGDSLRSVGEYGSWQWNYDTTPGRNSTIITSPLGTEFEVGVTYTGFSSPIAGGFVGKYNADTDYRGSSPGLRFSGTGWDGTVSGESALTQIPTTTSETTQVVNEVDSTIIDDVPQQEQVVVEQADVSTTTTETPSAFTETTGPNSQLASTLSSYQTGNTYGYTNTGVIEPIKPTGVGSYTGQYGYGSDGSTWIWIPGQGGWTKVSQI